MSVSHFKLSLFAAVSQTHKCDVNDKHLCPVVKHNSPLGFTQSSTSAEFRSAKSQQQTGNKPGRRVRRVAPRH